MRVKTNVRLMVTHIFVCFNIYPMWCVYISYAYIIRTKEVNMFGLLNMVMLCAHFVGILKAYMYAKIMVCFGGYVLAKSDYV